MPRTIAALYVDPAGPYVGLPDVERMHLDVKRAQWAAAEREGRYLEADTYAGQVGDLLGRIHNGSSRAPAALNHVLELTRVQHARRMRMRAPW